MKKTFARLVSLAMALTMLLCSAPAFAQEVVPSWLEDTSPITLSMYINEDFPFAWDCGSEIFDEITRRTGVTLNLTSASGTDGDIKLNAMIASDTLPDIVVSAFWRPSWATLQGSGMFYDLTELIDQYCPEARQFLPQSMVDWYRTEDGGFYSWISQFYAPEYVEQAQGEVSYTSNNGAYMARKDIMDQLGIKPEDFATFDGMFEALKKVKDANLTYNGMPVVPMMGMVYNDNPLWVAYGLDVQEDAEGNFLPVYYNPKYLESWVDYNKLWNAGLVYSDQFTSEDTQQGEVLASGRVFLVNTAAIYISSSYEALRKQDPNFEYVPVEMPRADDGMDPAFASSGAGGWIAGFISKNCSNPERAIEFLCFLNSEEGQLLNTYGIEGKHWNFDEETGHVAYTDYYFEQMEKGDNSTLMLYFFQNNPIYLFQQVQPLEQTESVEWQNSIKEYFGKYTFNEIAFTSLDPTNDDLIAIRNQSDEIMARAEVQMAMAKDEEGVRAVYEDAIAQIKALGYDRVVEWMSSQYEANKARLGWDYGYSGHEKE